MLSTGDRFEPKGGRVVVREAEGVCLDELLVLFDRAVEGVGLTFIVVAGMSNT